MEFLEKFRIISSWTGFFHTVMAILAMALGTIVLWGKKGTKRHKKIGYAYVISMLLLNISAFGIYNFGGVSLFHGFAIVSLFAIGMGIVPAIKRSSPKWYGRHFYFMSWSVIGLYCAFWAEIGVRFFNMQYFWWIVMLATMLTSFVGAKIVNKEARKLNLGK
jgi:uncharacterized membrane protein